MGARRSPTIASIVVSRSGRRLRFDGDACFDHRQSTGSDPENGSRLKYQRTGSRIWEINRRGKIRRRQIR
jgi:hypothetical protein